MPRRYKRTRLLSKPTTAGLGGTLGSALGAWTGIPGASAVGGYLGNAAHSLASSFLGWGDYAIGVNSLINPETGVPNLSKGVDASTIRVRHSEYLGDISVSSGTTFVAQFSQPINPGNPAVFPWLSTIAQGFEQWSPKGIVFEFKSTASTNVSSGTNLGNLAIASDYDVYDDPPTSRVQMLQMAFSQDGSVGANAYHGLECDPKQNPLGKYWILHDNEIVEGSAREYHLCQTTLAANNGAAAGVVGGLWIHYDIELSKECMPRNFVWTEKYFNTAFTIAAPFGTTGNWTAEKSSDSVIEPTKYTFPSNIKNGDVFLMMWRWTFSTVPTSTIALGTISLSKLVKWGSAAGYLGLFKNDTLGTSYMSESIDSTTVNLGGGTSAFNLDFTTAVLVKGYNPGTTPPSYTFTLVNGGALVATTVAFTIMKIGFEPN